MAMSVSGLKSDLKADLISLYKDCTSGSGVSGDYFADKLADLIATRVVSHIAANAKVTPGAGWASPDGPVSGGPTGTIS